jgi:IclR family transcriptional regulator, KDG regulon repressor
MSEDMRETVAADPLDEADLDESDAGSLVKAVQRALRIVSLFDSRRPEWSPSELGRASGLRRTTAFRLMKTLEAEGVISLNKQTGNYSLGPAVFRLAYVWVSQAGLARIARPHLERLTAATGETSNLMVWNGEGSLCVAHWPSPRPFKLMMSEGQASTDLANADSKVLVAFGPEQRRAECLRRSLEPLTPFTITDPQRMADELQHVTREGLAYDVQEQQLGVCAVSAPVWDFSNEVRASMSVVVSEARYSPTEARRFGQMLKQVAAALSYDLGYRPEDTGSSGGPDVPESRSVTP